MENPGKSMNHTSAQATPSTPVLSTEPNDAKCEGEFQGRSESPPDSALDRTKKGFARGNKDPMRTVGRETSFRGPGREDGDGIDFPRPLLLLAPADRGHPGFEPARHPFEQSAKLADYGQKGSRMQHWPRSSSGIS